MESVRLEFDEFKIKYIKEIERIFSRLEKRFTDCDGFARALYTSASKYVQEVAGRGEERGVSKFLHELHHADLYLAHSCAEGNEQAWESFLKEHRGFLESLARQFSGSDLDWEELLDTLLAELYGIGRDGGVRRSKFAHYSGRGSLRGWLKAVVFQLSVDLRRSGKRLVQPEDDREFERHTAPVEPEERVEEHYNTAISNALSTAISRQDPQMRLLLSYYYYDNLTLKQIGHIFRVHEATVSRWLQRVQQQLRRDVEKILSRDFAMSVAEVEACLRLAAEGGVADVKAMLDETRSQGP